MSRSILCIALASFAVICGLALYFSFEDTQLHFTSSAKSKFNLRDPEQSDDPLVVQGFRVMQLTQKLAAEYSGDRISCNNCHFDAGNSPGGKNNGISLVGVTYEYPRFSKRSGRDIDLPERISNCFERSINGKAVPADAPIMQAMIAYLAWISEPVKDIKNRDWLGLPPLKTKHQPDSKQGKKLYELHCASCHGIDGGGKVEEEGNNIPPLWGDDAFNDGAGMNNPHTFGSFIYWNMPLGQPYLTEEQALDIAAYVTKQPRPHFKN